MVKIKPVSDNVLVEPLEREERLPSGLVIPDSAKEKPQEGKVIAVGPGRMEHGALLKMEVKVGDRVLYKRYGGDEIKVEGKEYMMISSGDILAVISD